MASGPAPAMMTVEGSIDCLLLSDCNLSPFGTYAVAVRAEPYVREDRSAPYSSLWLTNTRTRYSIKLTAGPHHTMPRWSPDGKILIFVARNPEDGRSEVRSIEYRHLPQLDTPPESFTPPPATLLASLPGKVPSNRGLSSLQWAPNSRRLGVMVQHTPHPEEIMEVYDVDSELVRLHSIEMPRDETSPLSIRTVDCHCVSPTSIQIWEFAWAPDSATIAAVVSDHPAESSWYYARLVRFTAPASADTQAAGTTGSMKTLWQWHGPYRQISLPTWSPEGDKIAFISSVLSDRGYVGGDVFLVKAGDPMFGRKADTSWEDDEVPEQIRTAISPAGLQAWNITDSQKASFTWLVWSGEEELVAMAHKDGGVAMYEINPKQATTRQLWVSPLAVAEASWPRFSLAPQTGMLALVLEGPNSPRELWAAEHHREHRTIVQVRLAAHRQVDTTIGQSPGKATFVLYQLECQGLLHSWTVHRRYSEFQDLREELMEMITLYPSARLEPLASLPFPQKKLFGSDSEETIAERKAGLELWLNGVIGLVPAVSSRDAAYTSPAAAMVKGFLHVGDGSPIKSDSLLFHQITAYGHGLGGMAEASELPRSPIIGEDPPALPFTLGATEEVRWLGADNMPMQGLLIKPVGAIRQPSLFSAALDAAAAPEPSPVDVSVEVGGSEGSSPSDSVAAASTATDPERWPLVVCVHGGPTACVQNRYYGADPASSTGRWAQLLANAGCAVFLPNYRGSHGWGLNAAECNHADMGGKDFDDITLGITALVAKGLVDEDRVGMCGWSYGGYAAAWATTHAKRFAATVMGAGICDWETFSRTSILHPWADIALGRDMFAKFSPLKRVSPDSITGESAVSKDQCAPTLILHGSADEDVPPDQAKLFYTALQRLGVESSLVLYKGAGHSVSAKEQMIDAASRVVVHFGDHLQLDPATVAKVVGHGSLR